MDCRSSVSVVELRSKRNQSALPRWRRQHRLSDEKWERIQIVFGRNTFLMVVPDATQHGATTPERN
jgi:hypothetical protein